MTYVISGTTSSLVSLTSADNPTTITSTGLLQAGLYAPSLVGFAWTITNAGTVQGAGGSYNGAYTPGSAGGAGIVLITTGTLTNLGTIAGGYGANGGSGENSGTSGAGGAGGAGVSLVGGGTLTNSLSITGGAGGGGGSGNVSAGAGGAGGAGVYFADSGTLDNTGTIAGSAGGRGGGSSDDGDAGGIGGAGVALAGDGTLTNEGAITGGDGAGGGGSGAGHGGAGGAGGAGVAFLDGGTLSNTGGTIVGGAGGDGGDGGGGSGGAGGAGGAGVAFLDAGTLNIDSGAIVGGTGGAGGGGSSGGGAGGAGGAGVYLASDGTLTNSGTITGGAGNDAAFSQSGGAAGGAGGAGISLASSGTLTNLGTVAGGGGGTGGDVNSGLGGGGGAGGAGVAFMTGSVTNFGTISGGTGGAGGTTTPGHGGGPGADGAGGVGVVVTGGGTLLNAGAILGADGADAVYFGTGASRLILDPGASFLGNVVFNGAFTNVLELASGATAGTLDSSLVAISGFSQAVVDFGATWTLTNGSLGAGYTLTDLGTVTNSDNIQSPVTLGAGAYLYNSVTGTISGSGFAVVLGSDTGAATVVNAGLIDPASYGVYFPDGGSVTNVLGGLIEGTIAGVGGRGSAVTVTNFGSILGTGVNSAGVGLISGGTVNNQSGGTIDGSLYGVGSSNALTVTNSGRIGVTALDGIGTEFGQVTNTALGTIAGSNSGVRIYDGGTVVNAGLISGGNYSVYFHAGFATRLIADPGAVFTGVVDGGNTIGATVASTLELAAGATAGTLSDVGSHYINFAQTTIDAGAVWTMTGTDSFGAGSGITNDGSLDLVGATVTADALVNNGGIVLDPSSLTVASLTGIGSVTIDAGGTLVVQGTVSSGETIVFAGAGAYLHIESPGSFAGTITGFAVTDGIDLTGVAPVNVSYAAGSLSYGGSSPIALSVAPPGPVTASYSTDGALLASALCFCAGTRIGTPRGDVPVQALRVGDTVNTWSGDTRPIVWIGTGKVLATRGRRSAATPVIVRKGALGDNVPCRDLHVTKGHSLLVDGVLIPVEFLVNHRSILWDDRAQEVSLYHVELDRHDVMVADGAPAESYRDDGNRWLFRNANSGWDLPPLAPCAAVLTGGPVVDAAWRHILDRAGGRPGFQLTDDPDLHLRIDGQRIEPSAHHDRTYFFPIPARPESVRIVSRTGVPAELGMARDSRALGVAVRQIVVRQGSRFKGAHAADALLTEGFHAFEPDTGLRWTDGDAAVPAALFQHIDGTAVLVLHVGGTAHYPLDAEAVRAA